MVLKILISIDQFVNVLFGGNPDETISSRVGRNAIKGNKLALAAERVINAIFWILVKEQNHCRNRIEWDEFKTKP